MNIFILDSNIKNAAIYHTDKHCVKMILEHSQILCTAIRLNQHLQNTLDIQDIPYQSTHIKHPCTVWASQNHDNFAWLVAFTHELHEEYKYRYNREHLSYITLKSSNLITGSTIAYGSNLLIEDLSPARAMPDECKTDSVVESYRNYYRQHKSHLFNWTKRDVPYWIKSLTI